MYHYTTLDALEEIFKEKRWRLTSYDKVRHDHNEGQQIYCLYGEACEQLYRKKAITQEQYMQINQINKK